MSDYFNDADGEELSYAFQFSHPDVANMTYAAGKFQITSMNYGVSEITVTGTDVRGEIVSQSLKVLVRSDSKALSIYPNPVQDIMNIRTGGNVSEMSVKLISAARGFSMKQLQRAVEICAETDHLLKSSGIDDRELMKDAVLRIAAGEESA